MISRYLALVFVGLLSLATPAQASGWARAHAEQELAKHGITFDGTNPYHRRILRARSRGQVALQVAQIAATVPQQLGAVAFWTHDTGINGDLEDYLTELGAVAHWTTTGDDHGITTSGGDVTAWVDRIGSKSLTTALDSTASPSWAGSATDGVSFNGTDEGLSVAYDGDLAAVEIFVVVNNGVSTTEQVIGLEEGNSSGTYRMLLWRNAGPKLQTYHKGDSGTQQTSSTGNTFNTGVEILSGRSSGFSSIFARIDATDGAEDTGAATATGFTSVDQLSVGYRSTATPGVFANIDVLEIVIVESVLTADQRTNLESLLRARHTDATECASWRDQISGNALRPASFGSPTYTAGTGVDFAEVSSEALVVESDVTGGTSTTTGWEIYVVLSTSTASGADQIWWLGDKDVAGDYYSGFNDSSNDRWAFSAIDGSGTTHYSNLGPVDGMTHVVRWTLDGSSNDRYVIPDGATDSSLDTTNRTPDGIDRFGLGANLDSTPNQHATMTVKAVVVIPKLLTDAQAVAFTKWLSVRFGCPLVDVLPPVTAGLNMWIDPRVVEGYTLSGSEVTAALDLTGKGNDFSVDEPDDGPTIGAINGVPTFSFNGTDEALFSANGAFAAPPGAFVAVVEPDDYDAFYVHVGTGVDGTINDRIRLDQQASDTPEARAQESGGNNSASIGPTGDLSPWRLVGLFPSTTSRTLYTDGVAATEKTDLVDQSVDYDETGIGREPGSHTRFFPGEIGALLSYETDQTANVASLDEWLRAAYRLP